MHSEMGGKLYLLGDKLVVQVVMAILSLWLYDCIYSLHVCLVAVVL